MHEGPTENRLGELGSLYKYYYYYYYFDLIFPYLEPISTVFTNVVRSSHFIPIRKTRMIRIARMTV